jgi:hypothetical protein
MKRLHAIALGVLFAAPLAHAQEAPSASPPPAPPPPAVQAPETPPAVQAPETPPAVQVPEATPGVQVPAATPAVQAPQAAPPAPEPIPARRQDAHFSAAIDGSYTWQSLYGVPIPGAAFDGYAGVDFGSFSVGGTLDFVDARTNGGLGSLAVRVGPFIDWRVSRFRLGLGFRFGGIDIRRATTDGGLDSPSLGVFARVSFDLFHFDDDGRRAIYLVAKASADMVPGALYGVSGGAGVRF